MVSDAAFNALAGFNAMGAPKQAFISPPTKFSVSQFSRLSFPNPPTLDLKEIVAFVASGAVFTVVVLVLGLSTIMTGLLLLSGGLIFAVLYRYLRNSSKQMALLSACMLLAKMEREFQLLSDFVHTSILPIERLLNTGRSTSMSPLPSDKQRHYFMLVQIRSAMGDRAKKIHECLDNPQVRQLETCFDWVRKEVTLHQSALAQSRTIIPLDAIESFTLALLTDLDPEAASEEFLAQNRA